MNATKITPDAEAWGDSPLGDEPPVQQISTHRSSAVRATGRQARCRLSPAASASGILAAVNHQRLATIGPVSAILTEKYGVPYNCG